MTRGYAPLRVRRWREGLDIETLTAPIFPTHNDNLGVEFKFTDNVTDLPTSTTAWFATGPPIAPFAHGPAVKRC